MENDNKKEDVSENKNITSSKNTNTSEKELDEKTNNAISNIADSFASFICFVVFAGAIFYFIFSGVSNNNTTYNVNVASSDSPQEQEELKQRAIKMSTNPFATEPTSIRQIKANPQKYFNKKVVVGVTIVLNNQLDNKILQVASTKVKEDCRESFDTEADMFLYYANTKHSNMNPIDISSDKHHLLFAEGIIKSDTFGYPIMDVESIKVTGVARQILDE